MVASLFHIIDVAWTTRTDDSVKTRSSHFLGRFVCGSYFRQSVTPRVLFLARFPYSDILKFSTDEILGVIVPSGTTICVLLYYSNLVARSRLALGSLWH